MNLLRRGHVTVEFVGSTWSFAVVDGGQDVVTGYGYSTRRAAEVSGEQALITYRSGLELLEALGDLDLPPVSPPLTLACGDVPGLTGHLGADLRGDGRW